MWGQAGLDSRKILPDLFKVVRPVFAWMYVGAISYLTVCCLHAGCFKPLGCKCSVRVYSLVIFSMKNYEMEVAQVGKVISNVWYFD